jgi:hypothetical protein
MVTTPWRRYKEGGRNYRIQAKYGIDEEFARRNNQAPHFSITGTIDELRGGRWMDSGGGAIHEDLARHFRWLRPYFKWHLFSVGEGPMHYLGNAKYWWEKMAGISEWKARPHDPDPAEAFAHTVILGALPDDPETVPTDPDAWPGVEAWLHERLPRLLEAFERDMAELERAGAEKAGAEA